MKRRTIKLIFLAVILMGVANLFAVEAGEYTGKVDLVRMFTEGKQFSYMIVGLLVIMLVISGIKFWELNIKEKIMIKQHYLNHSPIDIYFKQSKDDFVVTEVPLYEFSGEGEHIIIKLRKKEF